MMNRNQKFYNVKSIKNKAGEEITKHMAFTGRFTLAGLTAMGIKPEQDNVEPERGHQVENGALRNTICPFGSFNVPRRELEDAISIGFKILVEDQGDGWTMVSAQGMTFDQIAELDSGLRWLEWLAKDGLFLSRMSDRDLSESSIATPEQKAAYRKWKDRFNTEPPFWLTRMMQLYDAKGMEGRGFKSRLLKFIDHPVIQGRLARIYKPYLTGTNGCPDLGTVEDVQNAGSPGQEYDTSASRWLGQKNFLPAAKRAPRPQTVDINTPRARKLNRIRQTIQITRNEGDTWEKVRAPKEDPEMSLMEPFVTGPSIFTPNPVKLNEQQAWSLGLTAIGMYERVGTRGESNQEEPVFHGDSSHFEQVTWSPKWTAVNDLKEADEFVKTRLSQKANGKTQWQDAVKQAPKLLSAIMAAREAAKARIEELQRLEEQSGTCSVKSFDLCCDLVLDAFEQDPNLIHAISDEASSLITDECSRRSASFAQALIDFRSQNQELLAVA